MNSNKFGIARWNIRLFGIESHKKGRRRSYANG